MDKTNDQWKQELDDEQYAVLREGATEAPGSGALLHNKETGTYTCVGCGVELFNSEHKFDSGSGWPSFFNAAEKNIKLVEDRSHGMVRTEVQCAKCEGHLGHLFEDAADQPTNQRYCINSVSLDFKKAD